MIYCNFDKLSFSLGSIETFCEMIFRDVKALAFSPALDPEDYGIIKADIGSIMEKYGVLCHAEDKLFSTFLAADEYIDNKIIVMFYKNSSHIEAYLQLKNKVQDLISKGEYTRENKLWATSQLCHILSYPQSQIDEILGKA